MSNHLYVGNIPFNVTGKQIHNIFYQYGKVRTINLIQDKSQSRGLAFVEMNSDKEAKNAIKNLNGHKIGNRKLIASEAHTQENRGGSGRSYGPGRRTGSYNR